MPAKRPTAVTVLGILNIVFSSLGLLFYLCCGLGLLVIAGAMNQAGAQDPNFRELKNLIDALVRAAPGIVAYFVAIFAVGGILSVLLLIGGIGILGMRNWARILCIIVAVLHLLLQAGHFDQCRLLYCPSRFPVAATDRGCLSPPGTCRGHAGRRTPTA